MTYIIGINLIKDGLALLISDIMVTNVSPSGNRSIEETGLKTGVLFKGCLYGLCGDASAGLDFLKTFKEKVKETNLNLISERVDELRNYICNGHWRLGKGFEILFLIRNPVPIMYYLDSRNPKLVLLEDTIKTLGSGKKLLDPLVLERFQYAETTIKNKLKDDKIPLLYYPYFFCLWLSELSLGFEGKYLNKLGVGGVFHFCCQTSDKEYAPKPAIYVLSSYDINTDTISNNAYRICFDKGFLIIDKLMEKKRTFFTNKVERPDLEGYDLQNNSEFIAEVNRTADSLPIYYFCGFAAHNPSYRGFYTAHISSGNVKVIDKNGVIRQDFLEKIHKNIRVSLDGNFNQQIL